MNKQLQIAIDNENDMDTLSYSMLRMTRRVKPMVDTFEQNLRFIKTMPKGAAEDIENIINAINTISEISNRVYEQSLLKVTKLEAITEELKAKITE